MSRQAAIWTVALTASLALHAGAAVWLAPRDEPVVVAGGAQAEIAVLGNAFQDTLVAGSMSGIVEPVDAESAPPVEGDMVVETTLKPAQPTRQQVREPARDVSSTRTGAVSGARPASADIDPVKPRAEGTQVTPILQRGTAMSNPASQSPRAGAPVEPVEIMDIRTTPDTAPRPTARPAQVAMANKPMLKSNGARRKQEKATEKVRQRAGAGGQSTKNARRGSADGSTRARETASGDAGGARESGSAAVSNYPGKVYAKLRRSLRYPSEARRKRIRGEVHVRFTVSRSGGVASVRVARSSGSSLLDNAALETVRRAEPFPEIPANAGRSSWSFTVPLQFRR